MDTPSFSNSTIPDKYLRPNLILASLIDRYLLCCTELNGAPKKTLGNVPNSGVKAQAGHGKQDLADAARQCLRIDFSVDALSASNADIDAIMSRLRAQRWEDYGLQVLLLELVQQVDRKKLNSRLIALRKSQVKHQHDDKKKNHSESIHGWYQSCFDSIDRSIERSKQFSEAALERSLVTDLPIASSMDELEGLIDKHQVVILAGETGSGKTTQIPKLLLKMGFAATGGIAHTQPRRLAARTVAARIASELDVELGGSIGYQFRFESSYSSESQVLLMTDGLLLAQILTDRLLLAYNVIIIDEAHERSLNIDFLLGYLKSILPQRPDLKIIVTSATIDVEKFSRFFHDAPILKVEGRSFPVEVDYLEDIQGSVTDEKSDLFSSAANQSIEQMAQVIEQVLHRIEEEERAGVRRYNNNAKDILIFLSGEREIHDLRKLLQGRPTPPSAKQAYVFLPLYARLGRKEQQRIFKENPLERKVILATNVAETSITVNGIGYVIDFGVARVSRFSLHHKLQRLQLEKISQASADQRAGRCGRVAPGKCYRIFSREDFDARQDFTDPEILRTQLAEVVLKMKSMNLGDVYQFPFIDPPARKQIASGIKTLLELRAVSPGGKGRDVRVNKHGRLLASLPLDTRLGAMLLSAMDKQCFAEVAVIVAALAVNDPREWRENERQRSIQLHKRFEDRRSDFIYWLNLWIYIEEKRQACSSSAFRRLCKDEHLSWPKLREWREMHRQLMKLRIAGKGSAILARPKESTVSGEDKSDDKAGFNFRLDWSQSYERIHRALIAGLYQSFGKHEEKGLFRGPRNIRFNVFPGSALFKRKLKWIVASEIVETQKFYARNVATIEPLWLAEELKHLLRFQYADPFWHRKRGQVLVPRSSILYGITLISNQSMSCEDYDLELAQKTFVREALAGRQLGGDKRFTKLASFWQHNESVLAEVSEAQNRLRKVESVIDESALEHFYAQRLPANVCSRESLIKAIGNGDETLEQSLRLQADSIPLLDEFTRQSKNFPSELVIDGESYALSYSFSPDVEQDGVSCTVPLAMLPKLSPEIFEWLVPGLLLEKIIAMIKLLPKSIRRKLVPVPAVSETLLGHLNSPCYANAQLAGQASLLADLCRVIEVLYEQRIEIATWRQLCDEGLAAIYQMRIVVVDAAGKPLRSSRDIKQLKKEMLGEIDRMIESQQVNVQRNKPEQDWSIEQLGNAQMTSIGGVEVSAYPVIRKTSSGLSSEYDLDPDNARIINQHALVEMATQSLKDSERFLKKSLLRDSKKLLAFSLDGASTFTQVELVEDVIFASIRESIFLGFRSGTPSSTIEFEKALASGRSNVVSNALTLEGAIYEIAGEYHRVLSILTAKRSVFEMQADDIDQQLSLLLGERFIRETPFSALQEFPRYLKAIYIRLDRIGGNHTRDSEYCKKLSTYQRNLQQLLYKYSKALFFDEQLMNFRWLLEELRVTLFAQQLKTRSPASFKRLDAAWQKVNRFRYDECDFS